MGMWEVLYLKRLLEEQKEAKQLKRTPAPKGTELLRDDTVVFPFIDLCFGTELPPETDPNPPLIIRRLRAEPKHDGYDIQYGGPGRDIKDPNTGKITWRHPMSSAEVVAPFSGVVVDVKEKQGLVVILDPKSRCFVAFRHLREGTIPKGLLPTKDAKTGKLVCKKVDAGTLLGNPGNENVKKDGTKNETMAVHLHVEVGFTAEGSVARWGVYPLGSIYEIRDPKYWIPESGVLNFASVSDGLQADEEHWAVVATAGSDVLYGGDENDQIYGAEGNDTLHGQKGNDTYYILADEGTDTIEDHEGTANRVIVNDTPIGDFNRPTDGGNVYTSIALNESGQSLLTGVMDGGDFVVTETASGTQVFLNQNFEDGDFGIHFQDELTPPDNPVTTNEWPGDQIPEHPNDIFYGTTSNELILCGAGDDWVCVWGDENWIKGGDGDDLIEGCLSTSSIIEGGAGSDVLWGSNQIFADSYGDMETLIQAGETAESTNEKGDLIRSRYSGGDSFLYGSNGNDIVLGGAGKDLIVGAGGDDLIISDGDFGWTLWWRTVHDWSYTIEYDEGANMYTDNE